MKPIVSIITPTYDSSKFLPGTIEGILRQTFTDWELIIVDDCSNDESHTIANLYAQQDSRIKAVRLGSNSGPAVARNTAIQIAQGRYIAFCDSDDIWLPTKLGSQLKSLENSDAAVCFTSYFKMNEDGTYTDRVVRAHPQVSYAMLLRSNFIGCSSAVYDSARCGKVLMPNILKRQDYGLWLRILQHGHMAIGLSEPLVHYRVRSNSVSSNKFKAARYHWKVLREVTDVPLHHACWLFLQYVWRGVRKAKI
jgi:teichuronic acid biosynthesis glycosyltransferase TuaG